jgi:adenylate kinase
LNIVLLGLPGAGKGTQATHIVQEIHIPHISTGEIFRTAIKEKTPLGLEAETFMYQGKLVPDRITIGIIRERLGKNDCAQGFLLDGFPRTVSQAEALDVHLKALKHELDLVLYIEVDEKELIKRLTGRRICPSCGATYHFFFAPPHQKDVCDLCGADLFQRKDDRIETVAKRIEVNMRQTECLLQYYQTSGKLYRVDGNKPIENVREIVFSLIRGCVT